MPSRREIRRRIRSVKNMTQITRAREMVSASKMRRAQRNVLATRPYADRLFDVMGEHSHQNEINRLESHEHLARFLKWSRQQETFAAVYVPDADLEQEIEDISGRMILGIVEPLTIIDVQGQPYEIVARVDTGAYRTTLRNPAR